MRLFAGLLLSFLALAVAPAEAAIETSAEHALLMDAATGQVLWQKDGLTPMPPASMSKLMTVELLFQRLKDGRVKLTDTFPVSERAWRTQGSKGFVHVGDRLTVDDLIQRIIVASGNDACIVVAESLGGTVEGFVDLMNKRAKEIGLAQSHFVNPDGLPDPPGQQMSALDLAKLSRDLINNYSEYYHYFSVKNYTVGTDGKPFTQGDGKGKAIAQANRDLALENLPGADGLKTGHIDASGYGITISVKRGSTRFILVLNGLRYPHYNNDYFPNIKRAEEAGRVMEMAFREFRSYPLFAANQVVGQFAVLDGADAKVAVTPAKPLAVTMQVDSHAGLKTVLQADPGLTAPIAQGQRVGTMLVTAPEFPPLSVPVYAAQPVARANIVLRLWGRMFGHKN